MSPRTLASFVLLLVACGGRAAEPVARTADDAKPASTASASASSSSAPATASPPAIEHWAFTEYTDFSGHGFKGSGRAFRHEGAKWVWAQCSVSHVADPRAGGGAATPTCGEWTEVPAGAVPALERLNGRSSDVMCSEEGALCKELGVTP